ncbi:general substrate transporter [Aureobasidium pullulans]|uniref:General substrate transporter n=1 Tax=Aureobasidium pullulans TaxID=5580 RepID=A0A4S9PF96_AURPU|nr:general substrate transporter [Aureobasidium pullulans]THZ39317.1 general substrate transporter [Aureobasidium pullulans]THZ53965.1 general substrate transporter [Aureobasidium pullulans]THZ90105.1 general substrate transporter [Aureobasidium pullulans]
MRSSIYQFLVGCFAAIGSFLFGYDLGVIAEVVASDSFKASFLQENADSRSGTVVALFTAGCFCGAFLASYTDPLGRRRTILLACCIFVVGGTVQTAGVIIAMLYVGRLIAGIGVGFLTMIIPIYQAELAHRKIRGKITSLQQLFNALGQIFATWIGYGCYMTWTHTGNSREWRIPLGCQLVPAIFLGGLIMFFPESPRWLCAHDRADEGLQVLAQLHAHGDTSDSYVLAEVELIQSQIVEERSQKSIGYFDLFRGWPNLRRTILVMAIQASCQMTGVSAIQYFSPQIFAQIGIPTSRSLLFQAVNAIIAFAGTTVCILTIDGVGRRPLQIFGHIFLCVTFVINAAIIKVFPTTSNNTSAHWAFVVMTWLFNFVFFLTSGPLSWAIPAELFGTAMRLKGVSWGAMTSFAFNTMIGQVTPIAISSIGWKFYLVFIVCNLTNAIFFWCFQPETKGLNLEDMDELFRDSPTFVPGGKWAPSSYVNELAREIAKGDEVKTIETQHMEEA